ncbi:Regulator of ribosome biosynthesis-like protein [Hapsidospora chrysogenum ATCC 11550]|uniref:Ribosome biogenesis regulatory protein n=1 Tax=Hapsidospora chrysogenum (strain ATCC 11550 / CBS 779.69 / DSM 880 / IAM 14645 / JCM 23072 / IMI 49137) TaxID=857340 RepID=A0A086TEU7_HAPC1|nr:Regulator of ribosome biosynthesis-like protein [Hapsidospora chrysogenum ATCC 11550]
MEGVESTKQKLVVAVDKPTPYTFDLGNLMAEDPNPVTLDHGSLEQSLAEVARDGAQSLINQLLTTCALSSTKDGVLLSLPEPSTRLPREKPVPQPKPPTKWERFAAKKGIKPKTREQRRNITFNEETNEYQRKWGYGGLNKKDQDAPIVEVDMKAERERKEGTSIRGDDRRERKENLRRNERQMRKNAKEAMAKGRK